MSALEVWGLDDVAETVYRTMLRNPEMDATTLARHLDMTPRRVSTAVTALCEAGLANQEAGVLVAASPATTLAAMLHTAQTDLEDRRAELDSVRSALAGFAADQMVGQSRSWSSLPVEVLSAEESFAVVEDLQRGTTGDIVSSHPAIHIDVDAPAYVDLVESQLANGRRMRGLYPADVVEDPARLAYVRKWAEAGEQVRLVAAPLPTLAVFGTEVAMVSAVLHEQIGVGRLVVRAPALVAVVADLFEQYWLRAVPLPTADPGSSSDGRARILELLVAGTKDESIARQLGLSLRTVRRRVAELMDELGARTRFQAGVEAMRRGLL